MTITACRPSSISRNCILLGISCCIGIVILVLVVTLISGLGASVAVGRLFASGFIAKSSLPLFLIIPVASVIQLHVERREAFKMWILTDSSIEILNRGVLVRSVPFCDISKIVFGRAHIAVFTRRPPNYFHIENLDQCLCTQAHEKYRKASEQGGDGDAEEAV